MYRTLSCLFTLFLTVSVHVSIKASDEVSLMTSSDLLKFPSPEADHRIAYGEDKLQYGELRLPEGKGPHPTMILIHGGCWLSQFDLSHARLLADAFTKEGIATWLIEYRRVGDEGGGWPGTFEDVANAGEFLKQLSKPYNLDLERFIVAGHSAGGHFALWFANRPERFIKDDNLVPKGVLALAPPATKGR